MVHWAAPLALLSALAVVAAPSAAGARWATISITGSPRHVAQGGFALLRYSASSSGTCGFAIRYADGTTQAFSGQRVSAQRPTWRQLQISKTAPLGEATGTLSCAGSGSRVIRFALVRPTSLVAVLKSGFTGREARSYRTDWYCEI